MTCQSFLFIPWWGASCQGHPLPHELCGFWCCSGCPVVPTAIWRLPLSRWGPGVPTAIWRLHLRSGSAHCDHALAVEVAHCDLVLAVEVPLHSGTCAWGPVVPTAIWHLQLRSGSAHCDLALAFEVRQCSFRSGACVGSGIVPTALWRLLLRSGIVPTAIWRTQLRSGGAHYDDALAVEVRYSPLRSGAGSWGAVVKERRRGKGGEEDLW